MWFKGKPKEAHHIPNHIWGGGKIPLKNICRFLEDTLLWFERNPTIYTIFWGESPQKTGQGPMARHTARAEAAAEAPGQGAAGPREDEPGARQRSGCGSKQCTKKAPCWEIEPRPAGFLFLFFVFDRGFLEATSRLINFSRRHPVISVGGCGCASVFKEPEPQKWRSGFRIGFPLKTLPKWCP